MTAYSLKWFSLSGNLLFYSKDETKDSPVLGVIVLEQCKVESEAHTGNRNAFKLCELMLHVPCIAAIKIIIIVVVIFVSNL